MGYYTEVWQRRGLNAATHAHKPLLWLLSIVTSYYALIVSSWPSESYTRIFNGIDSGVSPFPWLRNFHEATDAIHTPITSFNGIYASIDNQPSDTAYANKLMKIDPNTKFFIDTTGRTRIFHGINAVYKIAPWVPSIETFDPFNSLCETDWDNLQNWGFSAVRLGCMWPGLEPAEKQYNQTYLDQIETIVNGLGSRGIYTILDLHQDLLSRYFCGEGIPDWAIAPFLNDTLRFPFPMPFKMDFDSATGYPQLNTCLAHEFALYYPTAQVAKMFQNLYTNVNGLTDRLVAFWVEVATRFASNPFVLGYELINEPFLGDIYSQPSLLLPRRTDQELLAPLYKQLHTAIRAVDDDHIIFFEPCVFDVTPSGFEEGPGGQQYNDRQAYSYHIYCGSTTDGQGNPTNMFLCNETDSLFVQDKMVTDLERMGVAGFMTEFGAVNITETAIEDLHNIASYADRYLQSWSYWQLKYFNDLTTASSAESLYAADGALLTDKLKALSRTYAQAVAGTPVTMMFDPLSGSFEFQYRVDLNVTAPTVIFFNQQLYYPNGFNVVIEPTNAVTWTQTPSANFITLSQPTVAQDSIITFFLTPIETK